MTEVIYIRHRYETNEQCAAGPRNCFHLGFTLDSTAVATETARIEGLTWSPDGAHIVYHRVARDSHGKPLGSSELWIVDADGNDPHKVSLPTDLGAADPDWSPDGSLIVFSSEPIHDWNDAGVSDEADVYTVRPDGADLQQLTHGGGSGGPTWTSDGRILFFSKRAIWLMESGGSDAAPLFPNGTTLWGESTGWSYYGYLQPAP